MTATCVIVTVVTPENVVSNLLTVDKNSCEAPCTISGTARWINTGGTASVQTDLQITVNGVPTTLDTGVIIGPGAQTTMYPFNLPSLEKGTYTIGTVPAGVTNQVITVVNPAHITAKTIVPSKTACTAPCSLTLDVTWENTGDVTGNFTPAIVVDSTTRYELTQESLAGGATSTVKTFTVSGLTAAEHIICPDPN